MRLTLLGCHSPYPGPGGATAGYLLETEQVRLLIDCGSGVISQLTKRLSLHELDGLILSHGHHDHVADVGVLQYGMMVHQKTGERPADQPLPIYAPADLPGSLSYRFATRFHPIDGATELSFGEMRIRFHQTEHEALCYACRVEANGYSFVYTADCGPNTAWGDFLQGADLLLCEATFLERTKPAQPMGHLSVREAAQLAEQHGCGALVLTHLFPGYTAKEVLAEAIAYQSGTCFAGETGMVIDFAEVCKSG